MIRLLSTILVLAAAAPAQQRQEPPTVRVATWNLENLGQRHDPPRDASHYRALGGFLDGLGAGVVAVQEVRGTDVLERLCRHLPGGWDFVLGTTGGFHEDPGAIRVGFLWDAAVVELLYAEELLFLPREAEGLPIFHRVPVTACFRTRDGALDFRLTAVHMKAGRKESDESKRRLEMQHLCRWLRSLADREGEDRDVYLLGDFNHTYGDPASRVFEEAQLGRYLEPPSLQGEAVRFPTIVWFERPIDHIAALEGGLDEVVRRSFFVHGREMERDRDAWRARYSDHAPVSVALKALRDGDPGATFRRGSPEHRLVPGGGRAGDEAAVTALSAGSLVEVVLTDGSTCTGTLLEAPATWVHLVDQERTVRAFPAGSVLALRGL